MTVVDSESAVFSIRPRKWNGRDELFIAGGHRNGVHTPNRKCGEQFGDRLDVPVCIESKGVWSVNPTLRIEVT